MPLETASTIADLVSTNPVGASDTPASLDDHIRLIKTVLKADALVNADIGVNVAAYSHNHTGVYEPVLTAASQVEMEAGTEVALRSMSPLRVKQAIVKGTATNDNASSGSIGEYLESTEVTAHSPTSLVNNTDKTITSLSLTAGDWDVTAQGGSGIMNTTTVFMIGLSLINNAVPSAGECLFIRVATPGDLIGINGGAIPPKRISIASTTTIYLVANAIFSSGTASGYGKIMARRAR